MSNILIIHSGLKGISNACLEIAHRLIQDGHKIFTGTIRNNDELLKANNLDVFNISKHSLTFEKLNASGKNQEACFDAYYKEFHFAEFEKAIHKNRIDLLLIDIELHEYIIYASNKKIPFVLLSQWFSLWQAPNNLPLASSTKPGSGVQQKVIWAYHQFLGYLKTKGNQFKTKGINRRQFILYMAQKHSFDIRILQSYCFPLPFSYNKFPVISTTHPMLEFNPNSRAELIYTYPMVYEDRIEDISNKFEEDLNNILHLRTTKSKRLIVVTYTTMNNKSNQIGTLLRTLSDLKECISIVSLGKDYDRFKEKANQNLFLYKKIPQLSALQNADLSINHGGIHTINECIHFKVPMMILSGKRYDQNGCAVRVQEYGCGLAHFENHLSTKKLSSSIYELLENETYKNKISELHESYAKATKNKILENHIQNVLNT